MTKPKVRSVVIQDHALISYLMDNKYPREVAVLYEDSEDLALKVDELGLMKLARHPGIARVTLKLVKNAYYIDFAELLCGKSIAQRLLRVLPNDLPPRASHNHQDPGRKGWVVRHERSRSGQMGGSQRLWYPLPKAPLLAQATAA